MLIQNTDLIPSSNVLFVAINVNTLSDVRRLLLQGHKNIAGLIVKACVGGVQQLLKTTQQTETYKSANTTICPTFAGVIISNLPDGVTDNFLIVHCGT